MSQLIVSSLKSEEDGKPGPEGATTDVTMTQSVLSEGGVQTEDESADSMMQKLSLIGKIIIDKNVSTLKLNSLHAGQLVCKILEHLP